MRSLKPAAISSTRRATALRIAVYWARADVSDAITQGYKLGLNPRWPLSWNRHMRDQIAIHEGMDIVCAWHKTVTPERRIARRRIAGLRAHQTTHQARSLKLAAHLTSR